MKMSPEHYAKIEAAITERMKSAPNAWQHYKRNGLSPMRFRWDVLHSCGVSTSFLYNAGLNDNHIDTALRKICAPYMVE